MDPHCSPTLDVFDQVISRNRNTYQWALQNQFTMERRCLIHVVLHTLQAVEGLEFYERSQDGVQWVPASERRIRQAVVESLEGGLLKRVEVQFTSVCV